MTLLTTAVKVEYDGDGATVAFPTTFKFAANTELVVTDVNDTTLAETVKAMTTHYTVTGRNTPTGGTVTMLVAPAAGHTLRIERSTPLTQTSDLRTQAAYNPEVIENISDRLEQQIQELDAAIAILQIAAGDIDLDTLINNLLLDEDFITLLNLLIANIFTETDYILQLGMLRYLIPILSISGTTAEVDKTYESALVLCTNAAAVTVTLRENDLTEVLDFSTGCFISFKQTTVGGQVTLEAAPLSTFTVPYGFLPKTRALNSIITATCELASEGGSTWTLSGDLAIDASSSVGQAVTALTSSAGVVNIDCSLGDFFTLTPTENITGFTFSNIPDSGFAQHLHIQFLQHASAAKTVAWPSSFKWAGGAAGVVSTGLGAYDEIDITTYDQGTRWNAKILKAFA